MTISVLADYQSGRLYGTCSTPYCVCSERVCDRPEAQAHEVAPDYLI